VVHAPTSNVPLIIIATLITGFLGGCTLSDMLYHEFYIYGHKSLLSEQDTASTRVKGTATIVGEVSIKLHDGKSAHGENSFIYLIPVTPYASEWYEHYLVRDHRINGLDPRSFWATRATIVGSEGRFEFSYIPAGNYYLSCTVTPDLPPYRFLWVSISRAGTDAIKAYATVTVQADDHVKVTVTRPPS
jgi:hypothetical protein